MNIKVVIIWSFAIILLFGLGLIGYFNQDLLLFDNEPSSPLIDNDASNLTCTSENSGYSSTYSFIIKENKIERVSITYKTNVENIDAYTVASNINQTVSVQKINGVSAIMYGGISDFYLTVNVNVNDYDKASIESMSNDFSYLSMVIDSINEYHVYKQAIDQIGITYTCE